MNQSPPPDDSGTTSPLAPYLVIYIKGLFMGTADAIPGVSGGTIALITGIYERLVTAIAAIDLATVVTLFKTAVTMDRTALKKQTRDLDLVFLFILATGIATAVILVSRILSIGLDDFRAPTNAFFFGLIAASAVVLYREITLDAPRHWIAAIIGISTVAWITGITAGGGIAHTLPIIFIAGIVTSAAMLLPGISGAALLYVLGQYEFMVDSLHTFLDALGGNTASIIAPGIIIVVFLAGVGLGLATIARAVRWAFHRDRETTLVLLVSLMVGALRLPIEEVLAATPSWNLGNGVGIILAGVVGMLLVLGLDRFTDDLDYDV